LASLSRCRLPGRDAVKELLGDEVAALDAFPAVEVHDWEFGGRREPPRVRGTRRLLPTE
jgi:hypothetical protein